MRINLKKLEDNGYHVELKMEKGNATDVIIHPAAYDQHFTQQLEAMLRDKVGKYSMLLAEDLTIEVSNLQILNLLRDDQ